MQRFTKIYARYKTKTLIVASECLIEFPVQVQIQVESPVGVDGSDVARKPPAWVSRARAQQICLNVGWLIVCSGPEQEVVRVKINFET